MAVARFGDPYSTKQLTEMKLGDVDTGAMTRNNNDHALSFDGTMAGLSGGLPSVICTVPVGGGTPSDGPGFLGPLRR